METPVHGTLLAVGQPEISRIQGQMGQRRVELRVSFPQVCRAFAFRTDVFFFGIGH